MPISFTQLFRRRPPGLTILWAGLVWTVPILTFALLGLYYSRQENLQIALNRARDSFQKDIAYRSWATERGGVYVPLDAKTPPSPYLSHLPDRDIRADNGKTYTLVNPAYMTRMVHELAAKEYGLQGHLTSLRPIRPENAPDPWERKALQVFESGTREYWEQLHQGGEPRLRFMGAFIVQEGCLRCHASQGYKVGDVRGGISVTVPMGGSQVLAAQARWQATFITLVGLWLLGIGVILLWTRRAARLDLLRVEALAGLEESKALYQSLSEHIPVSLFRRDCEGRLVYANPAMLRDFGLPLEECLGHRHTDHHAKDQAARLQEEDDQVLAGATLHRIRAYRVPSTGEEQSREVVKSPVRNARGEIVGLQGVSWDVTERVQQDHAVKHLLEQYQAVIQTAVDGFLRIGPDDRILEVNDAYCRISGYNREELLGKPLHELVVGETPEQISARYRKVQEEGLGYFQVRHRTRDDRLVDLEISVTFLPSMGFCVVFLRDITERNLATVERKRLETEVLHMQKIESLGRLAGGVAHDMNNVLGAIMAISGLLAVKHPEDSGIQKDVNNLMNAANRGRDLVQGLNQFARKELHEPVPLDLNELMRREAELLRRTTLQAVEVVLELEEPLPFVRGEANVLANALMNLCVNALDAMAGKGRLRLATHCLPPDQVELVVEDSGEGMTPDVLAKAMEPFFTTKPAGKGTGLGLSMVYGAVKAHAGTLDLQSMPGAGTRVTIRLPATEAAPASAQGPAVASAAKRQKLRVLLVDDDEMILATIPPMLSALGHQVTAASSGAEALRRLEAGLGVDLVVLDLNMPAMDGREMLGRLRLVQPDLPVLMATGNSGDLGLDDFLARDGRAALLRKPFTLTELQDKIRAFLG
jgi:PAS domain S-box-containing protein